jgi:hypothetical protein
MDLGDIWFNSAEVEVGKSFLGLNVLMGDEDDVELDFAVDDRLGVLTGVSSSFGSNAAFFIIPISRLRRACKRTDQLRASPLARHENPSPQLVVLAPEILQLVPDRIDQPIPILDMILELVDVRLPSVPKRSSRELVSQLSLLLGRHLFVLLGLQKSAQYNVVSDRLFNGTYLTLPSDDTHARSPIILLPRLLPIL